MKGTVNVSNLSVSFYGNEVVRNISFSFNTGNLTGIIGPNGAGKSTLLKAILAFIHKDRGELESWGQPRKQVRKNSAYAPPRSDIDWNLPLVVRDPLLIGTYPTLGLVRRPEKSDKEWAYHCLETAGMQQYS